MSRNDRLFNSTDWFSVSEERKAAIRNEINELDPDQLLNTSVDTAVQHFVEKNTVPVPVLDRDNIVIENREASRMVNDYGRQVRVTTTEIVVTVPFSGATDAFRIKPSTYRMSAPLAHIATRQLVFTVDASNRDAAQVRDEIEETLDDIEFNLNNLRNDVASFQKDVPVFARNLIEARRSKLLADRNLVSELGYKLKERSDTPHTYAPPEVRRKITSSLPPKGNAPFKPEPALTSADYKHILSVISDMAIVMERSPSAFKNLNEEALRFQFLVPLNGHYEGAASGETFNYQGKTDILIQVDGRSIFIAECKIWSGPKNLSETVDQLLGYTSWRDTKTAIIVFNRNKNFTKVLEAIPPTMQAHPNYLRSEEFSGETQFRFTFRHLDDSSRELTLTVLAFDVPNS
ncbi:MAG: hypothetical protein ACFE0S_08065 [Rhodospirillales bacterium]